MDENVEVALRFTAAQLAAATAGIHLWIGLRPLLLYAQVGEPLTDPRQALFVLSSLAVLVGIGLAAYGLRRDYVYGLGIVLALTYIVGWLLLGGHPEGNEIIAYAWESTGHTHGSPLGTLVEHLFGSIWLVTTKTIETVLLGILVVLLYHERFGGDTADGTTDDTRDGDAEAAP
jgi:hypothetical protein